MSENTAAPVTTQKSRTKIIVAVLSVLVLLLVYGAGIIALPVSILTNFQGRDCDSVLSLHKVYTGLYPGFVEDPTMSAPVRECEAYTLAITNETSGNWREAYDAYQAYSTTYPNGLYSSEAHEHGAVVLLSLTKEQVEQDKHEEAIAGLDLIVSNYSDTGASAEAWTLFPSTYTSWGTSLRESREFERSEQVLNDFKAWSQSNQKTNLTTDAQRELAKMYLAWGQAFQSQKQFEKALAKFDLATSVDPQSQFETAVQVKAGQRQVFVEWGNDLLTRNEFPVAIEKFGLAVSKADGDHDDGARDALANGQIQWASSLSTDEDFMGALEHLEIAKQSAFTDPMKGSVDTALEETYLAFSSSDGIQAQRAMKQVLVTVCDKHDPPELPIFGLNKDEIRFAISEPDTTLPENVSARTPGEMHYIACVKTENQIVESRLKKQIVLYVSGGYFYRFVEQSRAKLLWNIRLMETATAKKIAEDTLTGGTPPPFPESEDAGSGFFYGPPPTMEELTDWFLSVIK